jgi:hypothetical protein
LKSLLVVDVLTDLAHDTNEILFFNKGALVPVTVGDLAKAAVSEL